MFNGPVTFSYLCLIVHMALNSSLTQYVCTGGEREVTALSLPFWFIFGEKFSEKIDEENTSLDASYYASFRFKFVGLRNFSENNISGYILIFCKLNKSDNLIQKH